MSYRNLIIFTTFFIFIACQKDNFDPQTKITPEDILSKEEVDNRISQSLENGHVFTWSKEDALLIWSALQHGNQVLGIGYKPAHILNIDTIIGFHDAESKEWVRAKQKIIHEIQRSFRRIGISGDSLPYSIHPSLPIIFVQATDAQLIQQLSSMSEVRYLEPMDYWMSDVDLRSSSGCSGGSEYINPYDYSLISPEGRQPWNFSNANIPNAWNHASGDNIGICIVDTGGSKDQDNLNGEYDEGDSSDRRSERRGTLYTGWWWWKSWDGDHDKCGHGTSMAGAATAPKGYGYAPVGVAYKADLLMIRAVEDVIISSSNEKAGVTDALVLAGNRNDIHIISMSIGSPFYSGVVADGIRYAYNKGKLIFAAGGTSFSATNWYGVIFPATMNETVAVTGVTDRGHLEECSNCHKGGEIDFTYVMQRYYDSDRTQPTLPLYSEESLYVGGSSIATASTAGIAALVWSVNLSLSRTQVLQLLKEASSHYPSGTSDYGYGNINAHKAVISAI